MTKNTKIWHNRFNKNLSKARPVMRRMEWRTCFIVVLLGMFDGFSPGYALPEDLSARLDDDVTGNRVGSIAIDSVLARYSALANVG